MDSGQRTSIALAVLKTRKKTEQSEWKMNINLISNCILSVRASKQALSFYIFLTGNYIETFWFATLKTLSRKGKLWLFRVFIAQMSAIFLSFRQCIPIENFIQKWTDTFTIAAVYFTKIIFEMVLICEVKHICDLDLFLILRCDYQQKHKHLPTNWLHVSKFEMNCECCYLLTQFSTHWRLRVVSNRECHPLF